MFRGAFPSVPYRLTRLRLVRKSQSTIGSSDLFLHAAVNFTLYRGSVTTTQRRGADSRISWVGGAPHTRGRRPGHVPRRVFGDLFLALAGLGMGITLALVIIGESAG